ncbi:orotidine-5'-phosphate decarboxylase [Pelagibacteraceae bacterium]|jgi:orotidine-5'-phosphate decarboxylase|nr:orotidine-5'-phosphate decarboxylase [Pelagibacteraceae bacterium]|tara:strand:+ start:146 stop:835 length:690 start_codon:yes stop_codon:yes gene_type:complete
MKKQKIFIACDSSNIDKIKKIIQLTNTNKLKIGYKFGLEFFYSKEGRKFISKLKDKEVFLDLKLNDIPNTCASAILSLKDLKNISYLTVHISGGYEMLKEVKKAAKRINRKLKVLGVTILTSFSKSSIKKIGHTKSIEELVKKQAALAKSTKLDGIVCSGHEASLIKKICKRMEIITPGIRLAGDEAGDQKRVVTPREAFKNGATAIVMGRSITKGDIKNNIQKLIKSL